METPFQQVNALQCSETEDSRDRRQGAETAQKAACASDTQELSKPSPSYSLSPKRTHESKLNGRKLR